MEFLGKIDRRHPAPADRALDGITVDERILHQLE
jgi:hypothetical protein